MPLNLTFLSEKSKNFGKFLFIILSAVILFTLLLMSRDAGMSGDEHFHTGHAQDVINFYKTLGKDTTAVHENPNNGQVNLHQFGQLPDNIAFLIYNSLGCEDIMQVRHYVSTTFGWLAMLFASLMVFRITQRWSAALLTLCLFFLSPHFIGHSFNNLKDPPFAAMLMMGIYYLFYFFNTFPKPPKKVIAMLIISFGAALAIRAPGLVLIAYFGVFGFVYLLLKWVEIRKTESIKKPFFPKEWVKLLLRLFVYGITISVVGFFVGILLWPFALVNPVHVFDTFKDMSQWGYLLRHVYEGALIWSDSNPWYYLTKYIVYTVPVATLIGVVIYPFLGGLRKENILSTFIIYFTAFFPVFWIGYTEANVYGGWRHATFMYPSMVVAAGLGFDAVIERITRKVLKNAN